MKDLADTLETTFGQTREQLGVAQNEKFTVAHAAKYAAGGVGLMLDVASGYFFAYDLVRKSDEGVQLPSWTPLWLAGERGTCVGVYVGVCLWV